MNKFVKTLLSLSIFSAIAVSQAHAATYRIIDKGAAETHKNTFGQQENNSGEMVIAGTGAFNFPVQYEFLTESDYDNIILTANSSHELIFAVDDIENESALRNGVPTENDLFWVISYLQSLDSNFLYQKFGDVAALINLNGDSEELVIFDEPIGEESLLTRSTIDIVEGITDQGFVYGSASAPYLPFELTNDQNTEDTSDDVTVSYWVREFDLRGFYSPDFGQTIIELAAPELTYGGISSVSDLNENGLAVGFASISIPEQVSAALSSASENCEDTESLETTPLIVCIDNVLVSNGLTSSNLYSTQAVQWQIGDGDNVVPEELGYLITPHINDTRELTSQALAVNNTGVSVGLAQGWFDNDVANGQESPSINEAKSNYAVVFKDGLVADFHDDHEEYFNSRATDINNNGIATGYTQTLINGFSRNVFFHIDTTSIETMRMVLPDGFFTGSSSEASSINDRGFIVGKAEFETSVGDSQRREHGFIYDITRDIFTDLNTLLPCDSEYTIIEANNINDNNDISASALIRVQQKDAFGDDVIDSNGDPVFEEVVRAVKMEVIEGEIETCTDDTENEIVERQGASVSFGLLFILSVLGFRRKFN